MNCAAAIFAIIIALLGTAVLGAELPPDLTQTLTIQSEELSPLSVQWKEDGQNRQVFWQRGRVYCGSALDAVSFDGSKIYWQFDNAGQLVVLKIPAARVDGARRNVMWLHCGYLDAAGWKLPSRAGELVRGGCQSAILELIEEGARLNRVDAVQLSGRLLRRVELVGIQFEGATESIAAESVFYLDPQLGYAIRRREDYVGGQLRARTENGEFLHLSGRDIWLPRQCVVRESGGSRDLCVESISADAIPPSQFVLATNRMGSLISDETAPGGVINFQIPRAPDTMDFGELMASAGPGGPPVFRGTWALLAGAGALSALAWLGWKIHATLTHWRH